MWCKIYTRTFLVSGRGVKDKYPNYILALRQNGRHYANDYFKFIFFYENGCIGLDNGFSSNRQFPLLQDGGDPANNVFRKIIISINWSIYIIAPIN